MPSSRVRAPWTGCGLFCPCLQSTTPARDNPIFLSVSQKLHKIDCENEDEKKGKKSYRQQKSLPKGRFLCLPAIWGIITPPFEVMSFLPHLYYSTLFQKMLLLFLPPVPPNSCERRDRVMRRFYRTAKQILQATLASLLANYLFYWLMQ